MASESRHEDVERRAYELYEQRGGEPGHEWDDWLQAEREMRAAEAASRLSRRPLDTSSTATSTA